MSWLTNRLIPKRKSSIMMIIENSSTYSWGKLSRPVIPFVPPRMFRASYNAGKEKGYIKVTIAK